MDFAPDDFLHPGARACAGSPVWRWTHLAAVGAALFATSAIADPIGDAGGMALVGPAKKIGHKEVRLETRRGAAPGAAWQVEPISLLTSFTVRFRFSLAAGTFPQADGIALVIQTDGTGAIGEGGGGIGYMGLNGVASVIQTYFNNHVGLNLDSNPYNTKNSPADLGSASLVEGGETVSYDAVAHVLTMRGKLMVDGVEYDVHDRKDVDLASLLGSDTATIGLTGGTGANTALERVSTFRFAID